MSSDLSRRRTSVPSEPPELLPGRSAYDWNWMMTLCVFAVLASIVVWEVDLNLLPAGSLRDDVAYAVAVIGILLGLVLGVVGVGRFRALRRERRAGYTTTYLGIDVDLWLLDRRTGEVLSRPGEPRTRRRRDRAGRGS